MKPKRNTKAKRGNGTGTLSRDTDGGPWIARYYLADGTRRERSTRTTSKGDAERMLKTWTEHERMVAEGLRAPEGGTELDRHLSATIASHLDAFTAAKQAEGRTAQYIAETVAIVTETAARCGWKALRDLAADDLERYTARRQSPTEGKGKKPARKWSPRTAHKCVTALQTFAKWCVADGRLAVNPIARVKKPAPNRQTARRMLSVDEWRWLRAVTDAAGERYGMTGHARRLLYHTAIQTGLRSAELRALTRSCLALDATPPYIVLSGANTKNGKAARQFVQRDLADDLAAHADRLMPGARLFTMPSAGRVAKMIREDLANARAAWIADAGDDPAEHARRLGSDFLTAEDHDGRVVDFHALRHTCGAWAAIGGASPKAIQTLMRHSTITLTLDTYGHLLPDEAAETVERMPTAEPVTLRLTGTDRADTPPPTAPPTRAQNRADRCDGARPATPSNSPTPRTKNPAFPRQNAGKRGSQAEREGFEPSVAVYPLQRISNPSPSASRAPLRNGREA